MRYVLVSAAATRTAKAWEITVRGIRNARPFVHAHMMRLLKHPKLALPAVAFVLAAVAALGFLTIGGDEAEAQTTTTVFVNNSKFCGSAGSTCAQPFSTQINPGDTVEWLDGQAGIPHTVTQCSGDGTGCPGGSPGFDSGTLTDPPVDLYLSQTFPSAGTFFYRCQVHGNSMRGIITVGSPVTPTDSPTASPTVTASAAPTATGTAPPTATATPPLGTEAVWGDANCSGEVNPVDSLFVLRGDAGLPTNTGECPDMGANIQVLNASPHIWGDVDCDGAMTPVDSLKILRYDAGLSVSQAEGCPGIGTSVTIVEG